MSYEDFFRKVCGKDPFPFQVRFHESEWELKILEAPTGLGKTNTVLVDWLYRRPTTRLVYCLPGRALTRQVAAVARQLAGDAANVFELMGGSEDLELKLLPHEPTILVGTQDILGSRALNRGYARSPFRWPIDFALLNNDVTWVFDEVQLQGESLATSTQLAAFRKQMGTFGRVPCIWMSATFERSWLNTVDFDEEPDHIRLNEEDLGNETVRERYYAKKAIAETTACDTPKECAAFIKEHHRDGTLTLTIANTVGRAQEIWDELQRIGLKDAVLLHSRFRRRDRERIINEALAKTNGVIVSTQVIEAGVELDARLMITDVAPWASLVQRFGRVNRRGEDPEGGEIYWVRNPQRQKGKPKADGTQYLPYEASEVQRAIAVLENLQSAAPADLQGKIEQPPPYRFVLRKSDLLDLFDTTPDLAGNHIDVSRFVRSGEETNVYVAWRSWPEKEAPPRKRFAPDELCPLPHYPGGNADLKALIKKRDAWMWNYSGTGKWEKVNPDRIYAGMRLLLRSEAGGYDEFRGWAPESKRAVEPIKDLPKEAEPSVDSDELSETETVTQTLEQHTDEVVAELQKILDKPAALHLDGTRASLEKAARYHDWGKAHPVFQQTLHKLDQPPEAAPNPLLAKQKRELSRRGHSRKWFRHELASALALLAHGDWLCAYIVMAHHGKVRLNIRSMPGEASYTARGIQHGDLLFAADLGGGAVEAESELDLTPTKLGLIGESRAWSDRVVDLLDEHGPFRLAFLEMLLRAADEKASANAEKGTNGRA